LSIHNRRDGFVAGVDLVAFRDDPTTGVIDELRTMRPVFTMVDGRFVYDAP
jgi:hypothetical protein